MLLHDVLRETAERTPESVATRCDGDERSYGALLRRATGVARALRAMDLEPGQRVGVLLGKGSDVPAAFYGVSAAGGVLVPVDPKSPAEQLTRILTATGATHLITEPGREALVRESLGKASGVDHVLGLEPDRLEGIHAEPWAAVENEASGSLPDAGVIELDPAYVLHTSGSTGVPKLIQHTHQSATAFVEWAVDEYAIRGDDRLSNHSSHHTCFATFDFYAAARAGAATVILTPAELMMPASLSALLERERVSIWYSVPTALVQLLVRGELESRDLRALRWVLFAGETFPEKHLRGLRELLPGARFSHVYGSTETNVCTYYHLPAADETPSPLPIGVACPNATTLVVDDALEPVPDGEEGELLVRGTTVMSGYWGEPERNRSALHRREAGGGLETTYFRTGDRVRRLPDGNLTFVARADLQVKVRGHRVELEGVEAALLSLEPVEAAAVYAVPDGEGSMSIRAAVVVTSPGPGVEQEIAAGLRRLLPTYSIPAELAVVDALPRTPTGKVDRRALGAGLAERR